MPKKRCSRMKAQTSGGRSARSWLISHVRSMPHSSSTGPSMKACSSSVSSSQGVASNSCQSGLPENSWPSQPTVPACMAAASESDKLGSILLYCLRKGALIKRCRHCGTFSGTRMAASNSPVSTRAVLDTGVNRPKASNNSASVAVQVRKRAPVNAQASEAARTAAKSNQVRSSIRCSMENAGRLVNDPDQSPIPARSMLEYRRLIAHNGRPVGRSILCPKQ